MSAASLLQRLKERKLVQWSVAYLAGTWALVEATNLVGEQFHWPEVVGQVITVAALFGFFVTLVLAWYHGEKGRQTVSGPELLIVALLLLIAGMGLSLMGGEGGPADTIEAPRAFEVNDGRPAIAVLPFTDMSAEGDQRYFGDGIADEILNALARISGLQVAARTSAFKLRDEDVATVGAQLGVGSVLEGSVRREGDRVRITAQLIQVKDGFHLWSQTYDRVIADLFAVQEEIAVAIADALQVQLGVHPEGTRARGLTDDLEAYQLYLLGRDRWATRSAQTIREAIGYFQRAIEKDSTFGLAYTGVADAYMVLPFYDLTVEPLDVYEPAKAAALRALELNPNLGEVHATLGYIAHTFEWDWARAERFLGEALELAPSYAPAHHWRANLWSTLGEAEEAVREMQVALALDPLSNVLYWTAAEKSAASGRTQEARVLFERAIQMEPVIPWALVGFAANLAWADPVDLPRAGDMAAEGVAMFGYPDPDRARAAMVAQASGGWSGDEWSAFLADLDRRSLLDRPDMILLYAKTPPDMFFDALDEAVAQRHFWVPYVPPGVALYNPHVMADPRWDAFLKRIGYPVQ